MLSCSISWGFIFAKSNCLLLNVQFCCYGKYIVINEALGPRLLGTGLDWLPSCPYFAQCRSWL